MSLFQRLRARLKWIKARNKAMNIYWRQYEQRRTPNHH